MYTVDERDRVVEIGDLPPSDAGAPEPIVIANEHRVLLAYRTADQGESSSERWAIVEPKGCRAHFFGPPNDEALHGHPLYDRGLTPYSVFKVRESSWIRLMEKRNRVHDRHDPSRYAKLSHFVFTFHDSTFECVAESLKAVIKSWKEVAADLALSLHA